MLLVYPLLKVLSSLFKYLLITLLLVAPHLVYGQNGDSANLPDSTNLVVTAVHFQGNEHVDDFTLKNLIRTHTNTTLFGIPGFTPFYGLYQLTDGAIGEAPVYFDYQTVSADIDRIVRYYESIGYLYAKVDTNIVINEEKQNVSVKFLIEEGHRSFITSVGYTGFPKRAFKTKKKKIAFLKASDLTSKQINDTTYQTHQPYIVDDLVEERERIVSHLKNAGYAAVTADSIKALIRPDSQNKYQLHVLFYIQPGHIFHFGDLHIRLTGPNFDKPITFPLKKVVKGKPFTKRGAKIIMQKQYSAQTDWELLTDQLLFKPGAIYNYERYLSTINEFQNLTMMTVRQFGYTKDGTPPDFEGNTIPVYIYLQTLPKHSISFNIFGLHRYGFGSGAGITYSNNNLFGGAENLQISVNGSFEYVKESTLNNVGIDSLTTGSNGEVFKRFEVRADYFLPKLTFPFASLNDNLFFANSRTRYSISYSESNQLLFDIIFNLGLNIQFEVRHNKRFTSYFDLLDLQVLDTNPTDEFLESINEVYENNKVLRQRILEDFKPQVSSVLRYTFRSERTNLIQRNYGYFSEYSISLGGNLPFLVDRFIYTPGTIEGELPSPKPGSNNSLAYSQYVKLTADYRRYIPLSSNSIFAFRIFGGYAIPYGKSSTIPINARFYAGGSSDIRGWDYYALGPGALQLNEIVVNGGEVKLLAKIEYRQIFLRNFLAADWGFALFADAGNVWYGPGNAILQSDGQTLQEVAKSNINFEKGQFHLDTFYKQIAVGSGVGLRLDFNYLVLRFDFAMRVHDLQKGWLNNGNIYFSFGVGHSF